MPGSRAPEPAPAWLHGLLRMNPREVPPSVALRNTTAIVAPLAIGVATGHAAAGLGIAVGALNTMFNDQPGPYRLRMQRMLLTALAAGLSGFVGSLIGAHAAWIVIAALVWGVAGGMLVALGPEAGRAGLASMILLVVTAAQPRDPAGAVVAGLLVFGGGILQTLFAIAAWPLQRYRPERLAIASACRQLAATARQPSDPAKAPPVTRALLDIEKLLNGAHRARGPVMDTFRVLAELLERVRLELLAVAELRAHLDGTEARATVGRALEYAARALDDCAEAIERATTSEPASAAMEGLSAARDALRTLPADHGDRRRLAIAVAQVDALAGQLRAMQRNVDIAGSRGAMRAQAREARAPRALRPLDALATLRANLGLSSVAFRHALRCGICLALAVAGERAAGIEHGYWIPMTTAIVLKPDYAGTLRFGLLRVIGTLAGLVLSTLLVHYAFDGIPEQLGLLALLCIGFRMLTPVHYGLGVMLLTGLMVILLAFDGVPPAETMSERALATAIGSVFALCAYALWPTRERLRVKPALAQMLDAYRIYFLSLADGAPAVRRAARIAARNARTNAEGSIDRLRGEPRADLRLLAFAEGMLANANRLVRACMAVEAALLDGALPRMEALAAFRERVDAQLRSTAASLRDGSSPADARLRDAERAVGEALRGNDDPLAAALADGTDRITDSADTLLHLVRREGSRLQ